MAEGVTYADLRFVRTPPEKAQQKETRGEGDLTYENVQEPRGWEKEETLGTTKANTGPNPWVKHTALGVLAACFFLLATTVGLGIQYWQVSGQLQRASQDHAAHSSSLAQRIDTQEESLAQIKDWLHQAWRELNSTQRDLLESRAATERTQKRLQDAAGELKRANLSLDALEREKEEMEARLCQQIGCCLPGWKLFRWKCLWISQEGKTWREGQADCEAKGSQLVILKKPWDARGVWYALQRTNSLSSDGYWIGLNKTKQKKGWVHFWVDGSHYGGTKERPQHPSHICVKVNDGNLEDNACWYHRRYICERAASPNPRPLLGGKA